MSYTQFFFFFFFACSNTVLSGFICLFVSSFIFRGQDILGILTKVNNEVSQKEGTVIINNDEIDAKMTPQPLFTLRKLLVFRAPKVRT